MAKFDRINLRREYFYTTPATVKAELAQIAGNILQFVDYAEAEQFRSSEQIRTQERGLSADATGAK